MAINLNKNTCCMLLPTWGGGKWEFFVISHCKGAVDGLSGDFKRILSISVLSKQEQMQNVPDFFFFNIEKSKWEKNKIILLNKRN